MTRLEVLHPFVEQTVKEFLAVEADPKTEAEAEPGGDP